MRLTTIIAVALQLSWLLSFTPNAATLPRFSRLNHIHVAAALPPPQTSKTSPAKRNEPDQDNVLRIDTTLITVPVVAMEHDGKFVPVPDVPAGKQWICMTGGPNAPTLTKTPEYQVFGPS